MRPTPASKFCRYSYDSSRGALWQGRKMFSDCGVWLTQFDRTASVQGNAEHPPPAGLSSGECCALCVSNQRVAAKNEDFMDVKPRERRRRQSLNAIEA